MLNTIICKVMLIVCLFTLNLDGLKGSLLCGDQDALDVYGPDMICCNSVLSERVDAHKRERDCCEHMLYYTDAYDCVDGTLIQLNQPYPLSTASKSSMENEDIVGFVRSFYIALQTYIRPTTQTENSGPQLEDSA